MFADDTNLFYKHKNTLKLFSTLNEGLMNINDWFMANNDDGKKWWENKIIIIP